MWQMYFYGIIVICINSIGCGFGCPVATDPCLDGDIEQLPSQHDRCPSCGAGDNCDKFGMQDDTWYRFDYVITVTRVVPESCGTVYPIWMNGSFPTASEGIVDRTGCMTSFTNFCAKEFQLKVKNCTTYHTYCMANLPTGCPQRFCFERPAMTTIQQAISTTTPTINSTALSELPTLENVSETKLNGFTTSQTSTESSASPNTESEDDTGKVSTIAISISVPIVLSSGLIFILLVWRSRYKRNGEDEDNVSFPKPRTDSNNHYETFPQHETNKNNSDYDQTTNMEPTTVSDNHYESLQPGATNDICTEYAELNNM